MFTLVMCSEPIKYKEVHCLMHYRLYIYQEVTLG